MSLFNKNHKKGVFPVFPSSTQNQLKYFSGFCPNVLQLGYLIKPGPGEIIIGYYFGSKQI